jgi:hypothetical protein
MGKQNSASPTHAAYIHNLRLKSWGLIHEVSGFVVSERLRSLQSMLLKYSPDQPRVPAGDSAGGQWTSGGSGSSDERRVQKPILNVVQSIDDAVDHLKKNADTKPRGKCATYVRRALNKGGFAVRPPNDGHGYAKNYGSELRRVGFESIATSIHPSKYPVAGYSPHKGDVMVMDSYPTQSIPAGHMAMYTGKQWVSDWPQRSFWPGSGYRSYQPRYTIYRYSK